MLTVTVLPFVVAGKSAFVTVPMLTSSLNSPQSPSTDIIATLVADPVPSSLFNASVIASAYAARRFAKSVACLDFSNCVVKIGIAMATNTAF